MADNRNYLGRLFGGRLFAGTLTSGGETPLPPDPYQNYPFVRPTPLSDAVRDFYIAYWEDRPLPFSLRVDAGPVFTVLDAAGGVVITRTTDTAQTTVWGSRTVLQWTTGTPSTQIIMRAVVKLSSLSETTAELDARTTYRLPPRVSSITVDGEAMSGRIRLAAGYNISLTSAQTERIDGGRYVDEIAIDAVAGAGDGRSPGCEDAEPLVRKINGIQPDAAGNFIIQADDCLRSQLPLTVTELDGFRTAVADPAEVLLASECQPCCDCDYFVRTYRGLKRMWQRWKTLAEEAEAVRDTYRENRERWLAQLACRELATLRIVASSDNNCSVFIGGSYCNFSKCCLVPVELRFTLVYYNAASPGAWPGGTITKAMISGTPTRGGDEDYTPVTVGGGVYRFVVDYANPQATTTGRFRLRSPGCVVGDAIMVYLTAHAPDPEPNHHGEVCVLPVAEIPTVISDIWTANGLTDTTPARALLAKAVPLNPNTLSFC